MVLHLIVMLVCLLVVYLLLQWKANDYASKMTRTIFYTQVGDIHPCAEGSCIPTLEEVKKSKKLLVLRNTNENDPHCFARGTEVAYIENSESHDNRLAVSNGIASWRVELDDLIVVE